MQIYEHLFNRNAALWSDDQNVQTSIANRLGWLQAPEFSRKNITLMTELVHCVRQENYRHIILLGMGGSSLAAEVFKQLLPKNSSDLNMTILDSTCPETIYNLTNNLILSETLFIVASKSGGTLETRNLFNYFYGLVSEHSKNPGKHFLAITDQGSELAEIAQQQGFLDCFINPSDIGGRYSALSYFGLIPAALLGWDIEILVTRAEKAYSQNQQGNGLGVELGDWLAADYQTPIHTLNFKIADNKLKILFLWIEQLVAESLGKQQQGILPLLESKIARSSMKTIALSFGTEKNNLGQLDKATVFLKDEYDIAAQFFHWELATAIAAAKIGVNPFDEPNVTEAKQKTAELLANTDKITTPSRNTNLKQFINSLAECEYLALLVYMDSNESNLTAIQHLQSKLEQQLKIPVTINFGPRYLHSVGQLHKGGKQHGAFVIVTTPSEKQINIPDKLYSFNQLFLAQAIGDWQSLQVKKLPAEFLLVNHLNEIQL